MRPEPFDVGVLRAQPGQELQLLAGQLWFGHEAHSVRTLLGSCVAVTLWHQTLRIGGMCHFLLPQRQRGENAARDARFGDEALEIMIEALLRTGSRPQDFEAHLYGGADTMPGQARVKFNIGARNIECGWSLIDHYGFVLQGVDVGDHIPRHVKLTLTSGVVEMRRGQTVKTTA